MFIISIPVYSFLVIPLLVSLGGKESEGAIISIGTIDFGLFLFVFCMGHIAYLSYFSTWLAAMLILNTVICNISYYFIDKMRGTHLRQIIFKYGITTPVTISLSLLLTSWTDLSVIHSAIVGAIIPALVIIGNHTVEFLESDLGIDRENLRSGKGLIIDNLKSILYTAPIVFHYIRYFSDIL
jgi:phosphatidate cytidylyltransferase